MPGFPREEGLLVPTNLAASRKEEVQLLPSGGRNRVVGVWHGEVLVGREEKSLPELHSHICSLWCPVWLSYAGRKCLEENCMCTCRSFVALKTSHVLILEQAG